MRWEELFVEEDDSAYTLLDGEKYIGSLHFMTWKERGMLMFAGNTLYNGSAIEARRLFAEIIERDPEIWMMETAL